jgi:hypothetical protein
MRKMAILTRRTFITRTTAGAAVIGVAAGALGATVAEELAQNAVANAPVAASDPLMVYVTDATKGELTFLMGSRQIVRRDPALVSRLLAFMR